MKPVLEFSLEISYQDSAFPHRDPNNKIPSTSWDLDMGLPLFRAREILRHSEGTHLFFHTCDSLDLEHPSKPGSSAWGK